MTKATGVIYLVTEPDNTEHLVRAKSKAAALEFVIADKYTAVRATVDDIAGRMEMPVQDAMASQ